ncbi:MAG TPA: hypothetical protein VGF99_07275, partial [Myxococcota bacterium]
PVHGATPAPPIVTTTFSTSTAPTVPVPPALPPMSLPAAALVPVAAAPIATSWDGAARARIDDKLAPPTDEQKLLAERFERLLDGAWHNDAEHRQLLKAAAAADQLAFVGARYRAVLDVVRDEPKARHAQQELLTLAMATMKPTATSLEPRSSTATLLKVGFGLAVIAAIVMGGIFASRFLSRGLTAMSPPDASFE